MVRLAALLLSWSVLAAQPLSIAALESARARAMLASPQWADKAWGAYFAGRLPSQDLQPILVEELRAAGRRGVAGAREERLYDSVLLDALIQGGYKVPAGVIEPLQQQSPSAALILLARAADNEESLLRLTGDQSPGFDWVAANNLLLEKKSRRWYIQMLGDLHITHRFTVTDPGEGYGSGVSFGCGSCGGGFGAIPEGFPPIATYTLQQTPVRDAVLLAPGPHNIYYQRVTTDGSPWSAPCPNFDREKLRSEYLAELAGPAIRDTESRLHRNDSIWYRDPSQFQQAIAEGLATQERDIRALFQVIAQNGLNGAAGLRLQIVPEVIDQRRTASGPLPYVHPRQIILD